MKITLPLTVTLPRKTKEDKIFALNLNIYRNAHHMILNQAKELYKQIVSDAYFYACNLPGNQMPAPPFLFRYTIYPGSGIKFDLANVLPIVQKFTDDALSELQAIKDDNYKVIRRVEYEFGGIDKENPRAELEIMPWVVKVWPHEIASKRRDGNVGDI